MKKITVLLISMVMLFSANCTWNQRIYLKQGKALRSSKPAYESSRAFFLWGLIGNPEMNVNDICGSKQPAAVETLSTFGDKLLGAITVGIYAPFSVRVYCE